MKAEAAFESAAELGYDGVELMVWSSRSAQDIGAVSVVPALRHAGLERARAVSAHLPTGVGCGPDREAHPQCAGGRAPRRAQTVVVHPPFRWQRRYAEGFSEQVAWLEERSDVMVAVENMFPFGPTGSSARASSRSTGCVAAAGIPARASRRSRRESYDPLGRQPCALHAGSLAHGDANRCSRHGQPDGGPVWCTCICVTAAAPPPMSTWCPAAGRSPPPRCARCWPAISPVMSFLKCDFGGAYQGWATIC